MRTTGCLGGGPGYVVDQIVPLNEAAPTTRAHMQWQAAAEAKAKDKSE
jgi:hypothetical protein